MSADLLSKLRLLEEEYAGLPLVARPAELREINRLRSQIGLPPVDARLREIGAAEAAAGPKPEPRTAPDHAEARRIYRAYLQKKNELDVHRAYAERVARATSGPGQTPVRPLATMGTDGGPLLCDHCGKPIVLEGGQFHGVAADVAWRQNPNPGGKWTSWVHGGMVVEIAVNGTLRIYHGYPGGRAEDCCNAARKTEEKAQARYKSRKTPELFALLRAFLAHEFPDMAERARLERLDDILNTLYDYDPGIGVNRPSPGGPAQPEGAA